MKTALAILLVVCAFVTGFSFYPYNGSYDSTDHPSALVGQVTYEGFEIRQDSIGYFVRVYDHYWAFPVPAVVGNGKVELAEVLVSSVRDSQTGQTMDGRTAYFFPYYNRLTPACAGGNVLSHQGDQGLVQDYVVEKIFSSCELMVGLPSVARITYIPAGDYRIVAQQTSNYDWVRIIGFMGEAWFYAPLSLPSLSVMLER